MPQYERGHSGQEIGAMQQRLSDLGFEVTVTNEFDEYTEEALRRYQVDWLYADGSGIADEDTLARLEYHHSTHGGEEIGGPRFGEEPVYDTGAGGSSQLSEDGRYWWDGEQWIPFANPTPLVDQDAQEPRFGLIDEETQARLDQVGEDPGLIGGPRFGVEPSYGAGAGGSSQGFDEGQWDPFANPTPLVDQDAQEPRFGLIDEETQAQLDQIGQDPGLIGGPQFGAEPMPDVRS